MRRLVICLLNPMSAILVLAAAVSADETRISSVKAVTALVDRGGKFLQPLKVAIRHAGAQQEAAVRVEGAEPVNVALKPGDQEVEILAAAVEKETPTTVRIESAGKQIASSNTILKPVRKLVVYILPHSHTDIGYTEIQTAIEAKQIKNLQQGIEIAKKTADYPPGARFVWNVEVLWAADLYLQRLGQQDRDAFFEAVKKGQVALNGMYLNELTGLCRGDELMQLFRYSTKLSEQCGVPIDSAMISDVPGYTWGTVTAMANAGIKYFSVAPNYFDRIGNILVKWENKPFYWVSPSGKERVLVWIPFRGYAMSHEIKRLTPAFVEDYQAKLLKNGYPYAIAYMRWAGHGDNAVPDPTICEFVKDWQAKYAYPKFIISGTSEAFSAFEKRYGDRLPEVRGDWSPYWEDGAGSSALETGMNRDSSDRITQAAAFFAMRNPAGYQPAAFENAWRNLLLYSEHTWGADCSVSWPDSQRAKEQWAIKRSYALDADKQSRALLGQALEGVGSPVPLAVDVFNANSWPRCEVVYLSKEFSSAGARVTDDAGLAFPSQRLSDGRLAFLARVPAFAGKRFQIVANAATAWPADDPCAKADSASIENGRVRVAVDPKSGNIVELKLKGLDGNLVDLDSGYAMNEYLYLIGNKVSELKRSGPATIAIREKGPLVAELSIESNAPGCNKFSRTLRLTAGSDCIEVMNLVDKQRLKATKYIADNTKESLNFAFPIKTPSGQMWLDLPLGAMRPELDQMPSACKNWLTVGRWADVSNRDCGVTWVTLDAPLVEVGGITATMLNSQTNPDVWRKKIEPTQLLLSWALNNHWGTNYRAYQEGPIPFRFALRPHRAASPIEAARLATALSQPLLVTAAKGDRPSEKPFMTLGTDDVIVSAVKPSDDGKAWIVTLFGAAGKDALVRLAFPAAQAKGVWRSDISEKPIERLDGPITVPAWDVIVVRVERG